MIDCCYELLAAVLKLIKLARKVFYKYAIKINCIEKSVLSSRVFSMCIFFA